MLTAVHLTAAVWRRSTNQTQMLNRVQTLDLGGQGCSSTMLQVLMAKSMTMISTYLGCTVIADCDQACMVMRAPCQTGDLVGVTGQSPEGFGH